MQQTNKKHHQLITISSSKLSHCLFAKRKIGSRFILYTFNLSTLSSGVSNTVRLIGRDASQSANRLYRRQTDLNQKNMKNLNDEEM